MRLLLLWTLIASGLTLDSCETAKFPILIGGDNAKTQFLGMDNYGTNFVVCGTSSDDYLLGNSYAEPILIRIDNPTNDKGLKWRKTGRMTFNDGTDDHHTFAYNFCSINTSTNYKNIAVIGSPVAGIGVHDYEDGTRLQYKYILIAGAPVEMEPQSLQYSVDFLFGLFK